MDLRDTSFEENEEYEYENENKSTFSGGRKISLAALRKNIKQNLIGNLYFSLMSPIF